MRDWVLANLFVHGADGHLFGRDGDLARVARPNAAALGVSGQLLPFHDVVAGLDQRLHLGLDRVGNLELLLGDHAHLARALLADYLELPVDLGDDGLALGDASPEQLLHAGWALGDVNAGYPTGVEGTHRQLCARLADRLGGDDADRLADLDQLACGQVAAVARAADALARFAHENGPHLDGGARGDDLPRRIVTDRLPAGHQHLAVDRDVLGSDTACDLLEDRVVLGAFRRDVANPDSVGGAAVFLPHDHVLRHVDETSRQVSGVAGAERGVGQSLAGAVGRDEVLEHRQAFGEVGLDRQVDGLPRRVAPQPTHTRELADLLDVAAGARAHHHPDRAEPVEGLLRRVAHLF